MLCFLGRLVPDRKNTSDAYYWHEGLLRCYSHCAYMYEGSIVSLSPLIAIR